MVAMKGEETQRFRVMVCLPEELYNRLKQYSKDNCISMSAAGTMAVKRFLDYLDRLELSKASR